jgi:hypothetical protein
MDRPKNLRIKTLATSALVALALLGASRAEAAVLNTSALMTTSNASVSYVCTFTNLATKAASDVTITLTTEWGGETHSTFPQVGAGNTLSVVTTGAYSNAMRCTASGKFTKSQARLSMQIVDAGITRAAVEGR